MCFVGFYRQAQVRWLFSNRDEYLSRPVALPPVSTICGEYQLAMPIDRPSGGTWIAVRNDYCAAVLLNGAMHPHTPHPPYRHSRGQIIPAMMSAADPAKALAQYNLCNIEPFTLVLSARDLLRVYRWDGAVLHCELMNESAHPCWSSSTLYTPVQIQARQQYWQQWWQKIPEGVAPDLMQFAGSRLPEDEATAINMSRPQLALQTISTTVVCLTPNGVRMMYNDYLTGHQYAISLAAILSPHAA